MVEVHQEIDLQPKQPVPLNFSNIHLVMAILALLVFYLVGWAYAGQSPGSNTPGVQATNATIFALEVIIRHRFPSMMLKLQVWLPSLPMGCICSRIFQIGECDQCTHTH